MVQCCRNRRYGGRFRWIFMTEQIESQRRRVKKTKAARKAPLLN
jgi:hypothetical protein